MNKHKQFPACAGIVLLIAFLALAVAGCGLSPKTNGNNLPTEDQISEQTTIGASVYLEVFSLYADGILAGNELPATPDPPSDSISSVAVSKGLPATKGPGDGWNGPDSQGWYTRSYHTGYGGDYWFTEKYRYIAAEKAYEYETALTYDGGDGHFSYENKYRSAINDDGTLDGYYDIKTESSGFSTISNAEFKFTYANFDQETGAGFFEWWYGADSLGADYVPFHRFLSINATPTSPSGWLHVHVHCYEDLGGDWEYDTPFSPAAL